MLMDAAILLPLYIYPKLGAWDRLYDAVTAHPNVRFMSIVNPHNGPGEWPNEDYARELPKLNAYPNVTTVGYIRAGYCKRAVDELEKDIATYASRPLDDNDPGLAVKGIFVDEVVNQYSDSAMQYLDRVDLATRRARSVCGDQIVIHNPGTAVQQPFANAKPGPDISVVAETSYFEFIKPEYQAWIANSPYDRSRTCYMLNSVPQDKIAQLTRELSEKARYLFLTSASANFYESFDPSWETFVEAMAGGD